MEAVDLTDENFARALEGAAAAVVDFHLGESAACILFKPKFKRLAADWPQVAFFVADAHDAPEARKALPIAQLPYFGAYRFGKLIEGFSTSDEGRFRAFVERNFGKPG